jgi:excisionase family DNA binding protein
MTAAVVETEVATRPPLALSTRQVAATLDCSYGTARNLLARGAIPSFKMGGLVRVRYSDLQEYVNRLAESAA